MAGVFEGRVLWQGMAGCSVEGGLAGGKFVVGVWYGGVFLEGTVEGDGFLVSNS